jgi:hypothetical protein
MKLDFKKVKGCIQLALSETSGKHDMSELNFYLKIALSKIEEKEQRELKKAKPHEGHDNNWVLSNGNLMHPKDAARAVASIDKLIEMESEKIKKMSRPNSQEENLEPQTLID